MVQNVLTLEFNELCPSLMTEFIERGALPNFARLYRESEIHVTDAEEAPPHLEPWVQWVTVHTGLPASEHRVYSLGDGAKLQARRLWDIVSDSGHAVWVCGSMNVAARPVRGCVLPDPWSAGVPAAPAGEFDAYLDFVRQHVQEHTRDRVAFSAASGLKVARYLLQHGLRAATVRDTARQLLRERTKGGKWKRVAILDRLQWDVFRWYWKRLRPAYATFFSNSTAHLQHMYWRNMEPGAFEIKPSSEEQAAYGDAVLFGYRCMDRIVGECLDLAGPDTTVVLCSALSQQRCLAFEQSGGKKFYRMIEPRTLFAFAGIREPCTYAPVMSEEFKLHFAGVDAATEARERLLALHVGGQPVLRVRADGASVHAGCRIFDAVAAGATLRNDRGDCVAFESMFYRVSGMKSGMHHPDGIFWVRSPDRFHRVHPEKLPLRCVAPRLLRACGVEPPPWMQTQVENALARLASSPEALPDRTGAAATD